MTGLSRRRQPVLLLAFVSLLALASTATRAVAAPGPAAPTGVPSAIPTLTATSATTQPVGTITVTGEAFTPGGRVYVALYDPWGATLYETRWITASGAVYGPNWSSDPAAGSSRGGVLRETFRGLCGATLMVRAYDQVTATWSHWLDVDLGVDLGCGRRGYPLT